MKKFILIFLSVLVPFICADDNITCTSETWSKAIICVKNRMIIHVNQTKYGNLFIRELGIDSIAPNAFQDLPIQNLTLTLPQTLWGALKSDGVPPPPLGIQPKSFEGLRQVKRLSITKSVLKLEHNLFAALESLDYLYITECLLTFAENGSFTGLPKLRELLLWDIELTELQPGIFTGLDKLEILSLQNNKIKNIQKNVFNHMKHLRELDLMWNWISTIEAGAFDGMFIGTLNLMSNNLTAIPIGAFDGVSIDCLKLYNNRIGDIEPNAFGNSTIKDLWYEGRYVSSKNISTYNLCH